MGCGSSMMEIDKRYSKEDTFDTPLPSSSMNYINPKLERFDVLEAKYIKDTFVRKLMISFEKFASKNCLGYRKRISATENENKFTFFTYEEVRIMSENFAFNMKKYGLSEEKNYGEEGKMRMLGIYSRNCAEWVVSDIAAEIDSVTVVPFYDTLGSIAIEHIFNQTELSTLCISPENIKKIVDFKQKFNLKFLKHVIVFDMTLNLSTEFELLEKSGLTVLKFSDMIKEIPKQERIDLQRPSAETIVTICYTSGTTSLPKGAKISQRSINAQMVSNWDSGVEANDNDIHMSYLPLAHVMERIACSLMLGFGGSIGFITGDVRKTLVEDMKLLHPTFLLAVPKVLSNFRDKIMDKISSLTGCKRSMIERAIRTKRENFQENQDIKSAFYDTFVLSKICDEFGGKWRFILTGSAPLAVDLGIDMKLIFGCPLLEGYGMTELGGAVLCSRITDMDSGHVGGPISTAKIRLSDCEELNYTSKTKTDDKITPCGEICVKGPVCFSGYFNDKENTQKIFDKDGWLHTGDVGMVSGDNQRFKIIDRIKEIFKLNQGEYIAPTKLETAYSKCEYVSQICIYGQSLKTYIIAIMTTKKPDIEKFLKGKEWYKGDDIENYYENVELLAEVKRSLDAIAESQKFNSLEKVQKIIISKEEFTIDNELLTPTAKVVRRKIEQRFKQQIDKVYV